MTADWGCVGGLDLPLEDPKSHDILKEGVVNSTESRGRREKCIVVRDEGLSID
jgi:hypothetical protein